jgi:magnesium chelatase subunit I
MTKTDIKTLGQLKQSGYKSESVKDELRRNLITQLKKKEEGGFEGIIGFEDTVIPDCYPIAP